MTKVGIFLTNQQPLGSDLVRALDEQIEMLHAARDAGWDSVFAGHHFLSEHLVHPSPLPYLARLAPEAGDMAVGIGILLLALQNPLDVAEQWATMDVVCRGRLIFGIGLGYRQVENEALGVFGGRVERLEQNLAIVEALWRGESVDADLPWCRLNQARLTVLPVQRPRPPLWMAANNDGAVERAARLADTWMINPHATTATVRRQLELFGTARVAAGRPPSPELPLMREVFCAATREEAIATARPYLGAKYDTYAKWGQDKAMPDDPAERDFAIGYDRLEENRFVVGSPDDVIAQLLPWREVGVDHYIFRTHWSGMPAGDSLKSIRLLADEVVPVLRA